MHAYSEAYLQDVVENQGKLFDYVSLNYPNKSTKHFIEAYMNSQTRNYIDNCKVYVSTMDYGQLFKYFIENDNYNLVEGEPIKGFTSDWIGEFYAYYQWFYNIPSKLVLKEVPIDFLIKAYFGLHDLELELAVKKIGNQINKDTNS